VSAAFADGTINNNDWELTVSRCLPFTAKSLANTPALQYDTTTYDGSSANSTLSFGTAFRKECISYVGDIDYHHGAFFAPLFFAISLADEKSPSSPSRTRLRRQPDRTYYLWTL
jgi:hypothetical protein